MDKLLDLDTGYNRANYVSFILQAVNSQNMDDSC